MVDGDTEHGAGEGARTGLPPSLSAWLGYRRYIDDAVVEQDDLRDAEFVGGAAQFPGPYEGYLTAGTT